MLGIFRVSVCPMAIYPVTLSGIQISTWRSCINLFGDAVCALARDGMRSVDGLVARQEHLDDLVVVVVSGEDERSDVG